MQKLRLLLAPMTFSAPGAPAPGAPVQGPPTSIVNQEKAPIDLPTSKCDGGNVIVSIEDASSQMALACIKLTKD